MKNDPYKTILVIVLGFTLLSLILRNDWLLYASAGIGLFALASQKTAGWVIKLWFAVGRVLGFINSRVLLSLIYFLILVPVAWVSRLAKGRSLTLKQEGRTYLHHRNHRYTAKDLEHPW